MNKTYEYNSEAIGCNLIDKEKNGIGYISKKAFKQAVNDGMEYRIVGKTRLKSEEKKDGKTDGLLRTEDAEYALSPCSHRLVKGYIPIGENKFIEYTGLWLPLLGIVLGVVLALVIILLALGYPQKWFSKPFTPKDVIEQATTNNDNNADTEVPDFYMTIDLPGGNVHIDGIFSNSDTKYTGSVNIKCIMTDENGNECILINRDEEVQNGTVSDFVIDFEALTFELIPGTYNGSICLTFPNGTVLEESIQIFIRQANSGSMAIGYSSNVTIDMASGQISCSYMPDGSDTHNTTVQLILVDDGQEYVLSQSGTVKPGEKLTGMTLDEAMKGRLSKGVYSGYLRLIFDAETDDGSAASINTDLEINITVQ